MVDRRLGGWVALAFGWIACASPAPPGPRAVDASVAATTAPVAAKPSPQAPIELALVSAKSEVSFAMNAPLESQRARFAGDAIRGSLTFHPDRLEASRGSVRVDLDALRIERRVHDPEGGAPPGDARPGGAPPAGAPPGEAGGGEWSLHEMQNKHARQWLEIDETTPEAVRETNRVATFEVEAVRMRRSGARVEPSGDALIEGALVVHGMRKRASVPVRLRVTTHEGTTSLHLETIEPLRVGLADFGVAPRSSFGALANKSLEALAPKVAAFAEVTLALEFASPR